MAQNQVYLIKSGENSFVEETQAIVGISGGKVGIGTTHPEADLHVTGSVKVGGDLTVDGTLTTINSTTVSVDDKNIELGSTDNPTDASAEGGGITVKGDTDKTFNWHANGGWTSSENLSVADGKHFAGDELRALDAGGLSLFDTNQSGITIKGGKVGIHKTAPGYDLDVDGSGNFGSLYVDGNAVLTGEGSIFGKWEDGATQGEIFYTGGNVGVGTTNPEHNFHVFGNGVVDGNFVVNGTSGTFNVGEFDVSGSNITLNSAGGGLDSSRGGLIVNGDNGTGKLEYLDSTQTWQSNQDIQIVADKHLQTDKVRAIDAEGLYLEDDGGNGIYIQDGGNVNIAKQLNVVGLTKADGGLNVGNGKFNIQSDGTLGSVNPNADDVIKWDGTKWVAAVSPGGGGGGGTSEVPNALINSLIAGESIQQITYGPYDSTPKIATDLEIVGDGSVIPYALSGVSETGYFAVFSQEIPNNNYKIHTVFGGKDVYWETGSSSSIYYNDGDVSLQRNLTIGGNLTVAGSTTSINTQTLEIKDHNLVIAANTGYNQLTAEYPSAGGAYAGILWGTGDAGAASPVSLTYQSNKGFAFEGGNVGIGTTSPTDKLDIASDSENLGITVTNSSTSPARITLINTEGSANIDCNDNLLRLGNNTSKDLVIDSAGRVGIGTTNPDVVLDVDGKIQIQSDQFWFKGGSFRFIDRATGDSVERMCIDSSGNVGIGTTNPRVMLDIKKVSNDGGAALRLRSATALDDYKTLGSIEYFSEDTSTNSTGLVGSVSVINAGTTWRGDGNNAAMTFNLIQGLAGTTSPVEAMRIDSSGNVGIGTSSPDGKIDIAVNGANERIHSVRPAGGFGSPQFGFKFRWGDDGDSPEIGLAHGGSYLNAGLYFDTMSGGSKVSAMRITSAGNVGIGITDPGEKLSIKGNVSAHAYEFYENTQSSASECIHRPTTGEFAIRANSQERLRIDSSGNVGIGTTIPGANLHIEVDSGSIDSANDRPGAVLRLAHNAQWNSNYGSDPSNPDFLGGIEFETGDNSGGTGVRTAIKTTVDHYANYNSLAFYTAPAETTGIIERMRINSSGNVGIGTTDPGYQLDVRGSADGSTPLLRLNSTTAANGNPASLVLRSPDAGSNGSNYGIAAVSASTTGGTDHYMSIGKWSGSTIESALAIDTNGNVGIGTTSPGGKLHVTDLNLSIGNVTVTNTGTGVTGGTDLNTKISNGDRIKINGEIFTVSAVAATTLTLSGTPSAAGTFTAYTDSNGLVVTSAGNVGIGTSSPNVDLHVANNGNLRIEGRNPALRFTNDDSEEMYIQCLRAEDGGRALRVYDSAGGGERMRIDSDGNVGIGTTNPSSKLFIRNDVDYSSSSYESNATLTLNNETNGDCAALIFHGDNSTNSSLRAGIVGGDIGLGLYGDIIAKKSSDTPSVIIRRSGNVGIGTTNPAQKLDVHGNIAVSGSTVHTSDDRVKHNEQPIVGALETLSKITPKKYIKTVEMYDADHDFELDADGNPIDSNGEPVEHRIEAGVIAQQVLTVDELAFAVSPEGVDEDGTVTSPHGLDYNSLFTYAIAAIQEQQQIIEHLKSQNESLAARISALES
jgi:hypothetical protein